MLELTDQLISTAILPRIRSSRIPGCRRQAMRWPWTAMASANHETPCANFILSSHMVAWYGMSMPKEMADGMVVWWRWVVGRRTSSDSSLPWSVRHRPSRLSLGRKNEGPCKIPSTHNNPPRAEDVRQRTLRHPLYSRIRTWPLQPDAPSAAPRIRRLAIR